ncbi:hypothetical protein EGR_08726 [Echinococcus granulosus]|uniref:Uncharacterized protein n=1 Tax=Echinococcus granulosus TaxID=6210 RepID=W6UDL2_ECHGR|nr:hypothetical protein EGR_08726 [Echinococcus granulosus]EUB56412.1 hypothetical protein EGR_08726 [Echinococcus granulosus]
MIVMEIVEQIERICCSVLMQAITANRIMNSSSPWFHLSCGLFKENGKKSQIQANLGIKKISHHLAPSCSLLGLLVQYTHSLLMKDSSPNLSQLSDKIQRSNSSEGDVKQATCVVAY